MSFWPGVKSAARRFGAGLPFFLLLGCESGARDGTDSIDPVSSARPQAAAVVLAGRPKLARLPPRVAGLAEQSLLLVPRAGSAEIPIGESRIGGLPDLPEDAAWPSPHGRPLAFVAQFDLSEVSRYLPGSGLPEQGMLYFFYDAQDEPWGYRPPDRDGFRVLYRSERAERLRRSKPPPRLGPPYGVQLLSMRSERSYPDWFSPSIGRLELGAREREEYQGFLHGLVASRPATYHRLLGHPAAIGGDPQTDCHLASSGIDLSETIDDEDPRIAELSKGSEEWRFLLQLDSHPKSNMAWGDSGRVYFFIRRADLAKRNFDSSWMVVQSR